MVLEVVYGALNAVFGPFIAMDPNPQNPIFTVFLISTIVAFVIHWPTNSGGSGDWNP